MRSPHPHARIVSIDVRGTLARADVFAVVTSSDLPPDLPPIPCRIPTHGDMAPFLQHVLARDVVRYVGEPIAVVVASSRATGRGRRRGYRHRLGEAPGRAEFRDGTQARRPQGARGGGNVASRWGYDLGNVDPGIRRAPRRSCARPFAIQRHSATPLETRGLLASYDRARRLLEVHGPTKVPHTNRALLATMLRMGEADIRFIEPDVGGSFGARGEFYPEDFLIPWLAVRLNRPIRWIEDRFEHFSAINHSRERDLRGHRRGRRRPASSRPSTCGWSPISAPISAPTAMWCLHTRPCPFRTVSRAQLPRPGDRRA